MRESTHNKAADNNPQPYPGTESSLILYAIIFTEHLATYWWLSRLPTWQRSPLISPAFEEISMFSVDTEIHGVA